MARKRRKNWDEPLHDFTAGPAVAPRDNPRIRTFEVFFQGCPTQYSIRLRAPVVDGVYQAYLGSEPLALERRHLQIDDALEQIAEHRDYLAAHEHGFEDALIDRSVQLAPGPEPEAPSHESSSCDHGAGGHQWDVARDVPAGVWIVRIDSAQSIYRIVVDSEGLFVPYIGLPIIDRIRIDLPRSESLSRALAMLSDWHVRSGLNWIKDEVTWTVRTTTGHAAGGPAIVRG